MKLNRLLPLLALSTALLCPHAQAARSFTDMAGRTLSLPDHVNKVYAIGHCVPLIGALAPEKLANNFTLSPAARKLVAPSFYEGKAMPGTGNRLSDEEIMNMAPDLVVMELQEGAADQAARLEAKLHVPVLLVDQDLKAYKKTFQFLGEVLEVPEQARAMGDFLTRYIEPVAEQAQHIPAERKLRVYYAEGPDGLSTNPAGSSHTQVLDYVGGINAAQVVGVPGEGMNSVSMEQLYLWQPDLILVWTPAADRQTTWRAIVDSPLWHRLKAVEQGKVVQIPWQPFSWFDRPPGTNRILGVLWLAKTLYPDVYGFDLEAASKEYFRIFYHHALSDAEYTALQALTHPGPLTER